MWNQLFWIQLNTRVTKMQELSIPAFRVQPLGCTCRSNKLKLEL
jgi:hypothetical protein